MKTFVASVIVVSAAIGLGMARTSKGGGQDSRNPLDARVPEFALKALTSPSATQAGVFIAKDGAITRYAVHIGKEAVPEWLHAMADEKIGKGEDLAYEAEIYPDGSEVYEIYRKIGGKEKQLSVAHRDRSVKYIGTQMDVKELPEKVQATLKGIQGMAAEKVLFKEGPNFAEYHIRGLAGAVPCRVRIGREGTLIAVQRRIPGEFEVAVPE